MKKPGICQICLHTDKELRTVGRKLSEFHDELCEFFLDTSNPLYCMECTHWLKKLYNFHVRCKNAVNVFKNWKKTKASERKPAHLLHEFLPPSSIGVWTPDNSRVYSFIHEEDGTTSAVDVPRQDIESVTYYVEFNEHPLLNEEIKTEKDCEASNCEDANPLEETPIDIRYSNNTDEVDNLLLKEDDIKKEECSNDDIKNESVTETISPISDDQNTEDKQTDEKLTVETIPRKKSLTELANITFSDDDFDYDLTEDYETEQSTDDSDDDEGKSMIKEKIIDKDKGSLTKNKVAKNRSKGKEKEAVVAELTNITLDEDCANVRLMKKLSFCKERLKAMLQKFFESCGDIKTDEGALVDKQLIIKCVDEKINKSTMRVLWNGINGKRKLSYSVSKTFKHIQNKYKKDAQYETVFDIEYLNTEEKMKEEFQKRKTYESYLNAKYKCEICYLGYKYEKMFEHHKKSHEDNMGELVCPICNTNFRSKKDWSAHMLKTHEAVYKCKLCPMLTHYRLSMQNHYEQHQGKKYVCDLCGTTNKSRSAYYTHMAGHNTLTGKQPCVVCGRTFGTRYGLNAHMCKTHRGFTPSADNDGSAKCDKCDVTFSSAEAYREHLRTTHEKQLKLQEAELSGTRVIYRKKKNYKRVFPRTYAKKTSVTCRVCNAVGSNHGWLTKHFIVEHPAMNKDALYADMKTHLCEICGKAFMNKYTLIDHMNGHTGSRIYACDTCPKRFTRKLSLEDHYRSHLPPQFSCKYCGKMFRLSSGLHNHMRIHIGDRCYKCDICGKGFLYPTNLKQHVKSVHFNIRTRKRQGAKIEAKKGAKKKCITEEETKESSESE